MITLKNILSKSNIQQLKLISIFICVLLFSNNLFAQDDLAEFSAQYAVQKSGIKLAEAIYQLSYTDTGYKFSHNSKLHGIAAMLGDDSVSAVSYIDKVDDTLLLKKHSYIQTGREKNTDEDFSIQWNTTSKAVTGKITGMVRSRKINLETDTAVWEPLSFQIPLMIAANENVKDYPYNAILNGEIDTYNFVLTSKKSITFANKEYQVLQMVRTDPHKNRQLHIWLAPELNNMPIIIENYRDGRQHSRMQLESVQFNNENPIELK